MTELAWNPPTGGETSLRIASRANMVIDEIQETDETGNVLVVSQKATIRITICSLLGIDLGRSCDLIEMPVAPIPMITCGSDGARL